VDRKLFAAAKAAQKRAHAPYSNFHVGAAIRTEAGTMYAGSNVENASYPEGWCAETSAIASMIAAGTSAKARRIAAITVVADRIDGRLSTPCGGCRQRIAEFAGPDVTVEVVDPSGKGRVFTVKELLPSAFDMDAKA
jgi:cytidine deaminase